MPTQNLRLEIGRLYNSLRDFLLADVYEIIGQNIVGGKVPGGQISGTIPSTSIPNSGVTAATYGDSTHVAQVTVGSDGRLTSASNVAISAGNSLTVEEEDGTPSVSNVSTIKVTNGTLTDDGSGTVSINTGGGSGNVTSTGSLPTEPGSPNSGDIYLPNNGQAIERYSGSAWVPWGPIFPLTKPPAAASWTWSNQLTATIADNGNGVTLSATNTGAVHLVYKSLPSAPYTVTFLVMPTITYSNSSTPFAGAGLVWRESASGKLVTPYIESFNNTTSTRLYVRKWNTFNSFNSDYLSYPLGASTHSMRAPWWWRLKDDGSSLRYVQVSGDGITWDTIASFTRTDFLTPDQVGLMVRTSSTGGTGAITLVSYQEA